MGKSCPCNYKCNNVKISFTKDSESIRAITKNDNFIITLEPFRTKYDVENNKIIRIPYEPSDTFKVFAYARSEKLDLGFTDDKPDYKWKVEKNSEGEITKVTGKISNCSFKEDPPDDMDFVNVDIVIHDTVTPGEGACGASSIYLTKLVCFYVYRYTKKHITEHSGCESLELQKEYDEQSEVELYDTCCVDPEETELVEGGWELIGTGENTTEDYRYCEFEYVVRTTDMCVDIESTADTDEDGNVDGDINGDGVLDKYDYCTKGEEKKPQAPTEDMIKSLGCSCSDDEPDQLTSTAEDYSNTWAHSLYTPDNLVSTAPAYSKTWAHSLYTPDNLVSTAPAYTLPSDGYSITIPNQVNIDGMITITGSITAIACGHYDYEITLTFTDDQGDDWSTKIRISGTTTNSYIHDISTTFSIDKNWVSCSYECEDLQDTDHGCPSAGNITGSLTFTLYQ